MATRTDSGRSGEISIEVNPNRPGEMAGVVRRLTRSAVYVPTHVTDHEGWIVENIGEPIGGNNRSREGKQRSRPGAGEKQDRRIVNRR